jgi:hypothetical protein
VISRRIEDALAVLVDRDAEAERLLTSRTCPNWSTTSTPVTRCFARHLVALEVVDRRSETATAVP